MLQRHKFENAQQRMLMQWRTRSASCVVFAFMVHAASHGRWMDARRAGADAERSVRVSCLLLRDSCRHHCRSPLPMIHQEYASNQLALRLISSGRRSGDCQTGGRRAKAGSAEENCMRQFASAIAISLLYPLAMLLLSVSVCFEPLRLHTRRENREGRAESSEQRGERRGGRGAQCKSTYCTYMHASFHRACVNERGGGDIRRCRAPRDTATG